MKKIITLLITACMIINSAVFVWAADETIFSDLDKNHYARSFAEKCYSYNLINSSIDGKFYPSHRATTADICDILYRFCLIAGDAERVTTTNNPELAAMNDVDPDAWYYESLVWAVKEGIVASESSENFGTFSSNTELEFMLMVNNALKSCGIALDKIRESGTITGTTGMTEDELKILDYFAQAGIFGTNNVFFPESFVVRGSLVIVVSRLIDSVSPSKTIGKPEKFDEKTGHKDKHYDRVEPTCYEFGFGEYEGCTNCMYSDVRITEIAPVGHKNLDVTFVEKFETKTEPGIKFKVCSVCGEINERKEFYHDISHVYMDVDPDDWYYLAVKYVDLFSLMNGTREYFFSPDVDMSRAMLVTVLYRLVGAPEVNGTTPFTDLSTTQIWYHDAVLWAYQNEIVNGTSSTMFSPDSTVTREQLTTILYRFTKWIGDEASSTADISTFPDCSDVSEWAREAMTWAYGEGIITGTLIGEKAYLSPKAEASRAQVATVLMRYCETE